MHQFFVEPTQIQDKTIFITGGDVNHIKNVLRMSPGDEIAVRCAGEDREYRCGIEAFAKEQVVCSLRFIREEGVELPAEVYLFQGIPKADKMELIVQKAVELGVRGVIPVAMQRCVVKLDEKKAAARTARLQGIAEAAAKQCRRALIPQVSKPLSMREALALAGEMDVKLLPYELASGMDRTRELLEAVRPGMKVAVFIGPEGGFAEEEARLAEEAGFSLITLGRRILRTETAGLAVLSWLMYHLE